jgi:hypothetical protein
MKSRIKLNKIFSEFENRATNKLNYFITNSVKRYTCTKFGNDLDSYLLNTRTKNLYEANKIKILFRNNKKIFISFILIKY